MRLLPESDCEKHFKLLRALEEPEKLRRVITEEKRHKAASFDAKLSRAGSGRIGKDIRMVGSMDPLDFFALKDKYGYEELHSKEFLRQHFRTYSEHRVLHPSQY
jgi:hypothetical protein